jgi:hypothetical protein
MGMITCVCDKSFEADLPESVELSTSTDILSRIFDGTFLNFTCPHCGYTVKPEVPLRLTDSSRGIDIFLVPERDRDKFLLGNTEYHSAGRIVIGYSELVEKLKIYAASLDDSAVELIKYYLLAKAGGGIAPKIYFQGCDDGDLEFDIFGLRDDEIGRARVPRELYEKSVKELPEKQRQEPFSSFLSPPYVSITKVEIEESER